jgi:hypothetical protein
MSERKMILDRLRKKESEVLALEEKLKTARIYVQALLDLVKAIEKDDFGANPESNLRPGSAVTQARDAVLAAGVPLHINELMESLGKDVSREARASLTSSLSSYVRRGELFTRPAPNTFGLIELGHVNFEDPLKEPPANFGISPNQTKA